MDRVAAVVLRSGAVLLARRAPGREHAGRWELPWARPRPGESPAAAVSRALREQLGLSGEAGEELARQGATTAFLVKKFSGEIALTPAHDQTAWVEARRLPERDLAPEQAEIAAALSAHKRRDRYRGTH